jgi:hypothetical protein
MMKKLLLKKRKKKRLKMMNERGPLELENINVIIIFVNIINFN